MDETDLPQTPPELLIIWRRSPRKASRRRPIARVFGAAFNKGVDYVGDLGQFEREFQADLAVIAYAWDSGACRRT